MQETCVRRSRQKPNRSWICSHDGSITASTSVEKISTDVALKWRCQMPSGSITASACSPGRVLRQAPTTRCLSSSFPLQDQTEQHEFCARLRARRSRQRRNGCWICSHDEFIIVALKRRRQIPITNFSSFSGSSREASASNSFVVFFISCLKQKSAIGSSLRL